MSVHTPGPKAVRWPGRCYNQEKCRTNRKCWWGMGDNLCAHQDQDISSDVENLMAAAPELLAALKAMVWPYDGASSYVLLAEEGLSTDQVERIVAARTAIAKAEGKP